MPFTVRSLEIPEVILIEPRLFGDARGYFMETYRASDFRGLGLPASFVQENHSRSERGSLRGLHFQRGAHAQGKLVRVIVGEVFDVAVDARRDSPTFGKWQSITLSGDRPQLLYVPPWCAHGFCVLSDVAEVVYKTTTEYAPEHEDGFLWNDPSLGIEWPIENPTLSERDRHWAPIAS